MLKLLAALLWSGGTLMWWTIILLGAGFAGGLGAIFAVAIGLAFWLPVTALLTDWLGLTRLWPHSRFP